MPLPRLAVLRTPPTPHGSIGDRELAAFGLPRTEVLDFSVSLNPLGPPPAVAAALASLDVSRYPEDGAPRLRDALAAQVWLGAQHLLVGNGASELLWLLAFAYLGPGRRALVVAPTYGEYARAFRLTGAMVHEWRTPEAQGFRVDVAALERCIEEEQPTLTALCNPNNPTGTLLDAGALLRLAAAHREGLLLVDEAYLPFVPAAPDLCRDVGSAPLVLLRSLTKAHGIAGLRLGYLAAQPEVVRALDAVRPPWSVNAAAQAAGLAALADIDHWQRSLGVVREGKCLLEAGLRRLGLAVAPAAANFLLVRVGDAAALRARLLRRGVCVRDCSSFGLPAHIRIGVRAPAECARLLHALRLALEEA